MIEERIKNAFNVAVSHEPRVATTSDTIRTHAGRTRIMRAVVAVISLALIAGGGVFVAQRDGEPVPVAPAVPGGGRTVERPESNLRYEVPNLWIDEEGQAGATEHRPPGLPARGAGSPTFTVTIAVVPVHYTNAKGTPFVDADGRRSVRQRDGLTVDYAIDWTDRGGIACDEFEGRTPREGAHGYFQSASVRVAIRADNQELWRRYGKTGERIATSLVWLPDPDATSTRHGTWRATLQRDVLSQTVAAFLDARADGSGAERLLDDFSQSRYATRPRFSNDLRYGSYFLSYREDRFGDRAFFNAFLQAGQGAACRVVMEGIEVRRIDTIRTNAQGDRLPALITISPDCRIGPCRAGLYSYAPPPK